MVDTGRFSNKLHFKYKSIAWPTKDGGWTHVQKPKIEVVFRKFAETKDNEINREVRFNALIDSGADYSFLPLEIAQMMRLDIDQADERVSTVAGETSVFKSKVHVEIPLHKKRPVIVGPIDVFVLPHEIDSKRPPENFIILGRQGFFEKFEVTFNETAKIIILKEFRKKIDRDRRSRHQSRKHT